MNGSAQQPVMAGNDWSGAHVATDEAEYLVFRLGEEDYAVDILHVREIRGCDPVTRIAEAPPHVTGVINLRGSIVPVVDMRVRFGLKAAAIDAFTVVIILNIAGRMVGIVVDSVSDVVRLGAQQRKPAPDFGAALGTRYITGLASLEERLLILIDMEKLVNGTQGGLFDAAAA